MGKPFDSQIMYAVGREERADIIDNTVIQEVLRGYLWGDRVLTEAQRQKYVLVMISAVGNNFNENNYE